MDVFIFFGDIPYPHPKEPHAYAAFSIKYGPDWCWMQCPLCGDVHIGLMNHMSCRQGCEEKAEKALLSGIYELIGDPDTKIRSDIRSKLRVALDSTEFFGAGHKGEKLRKAYEAARSARFEQNHLHRIK